MNDLISRAAAIEAVTNADRNCLGAHGAREALRALPAASQPEAEPVAKGRFMDLPTKLRRAGEIVASGMVSDGQILWISDVVEDAALKIESRPTPAPVVPAEGMREVETKLKAMIAGFRHGLDPEGCSYDAGIRDVLDKLAAILAAAEKGAGNG